MMPPALLHTIKSQKVETAAARFFYRYTVSYDYVDNIVVLRQNRPARVELRRYAYYFAALPEILFASLQFRSL